MPSIFGVLGRSATYVAQAVAALPPADKVLAPAAPVRRVERSQTIRLPARTLPATPASTEASGDLPTIWPGGADEPPEGPNGFAILSDGSLLITDPLARRLLLYSPRGSLRKAIPLGFPADSLRITEGDSVSVRDATTSEEHPVPGFGAAAAAIASRQPRVQLASARLATLTWQAAAGQPDRVLRVTLDDGGTTLLSVECLMVQPDLTTYVALELTSHDESDDTIHLRKDVRRYTASGQLISEITDLPLGYFIAPVDELRVHGDTVYQLMTTPSEVLINLWRTSPTA